jgi:hypothetical protein
MAARAGLGDGMKRMGPPAFSVSLLVHNFKGTVVAHGNRHGRMAFWA